MSELSQEEFLCNRIRATEQALMAHHESVLRQHGLTMTQYLVLLTLSRIESQSASQLARACGVTPQTMASVLKVLENKQLVRRETSPVHAKVQLVMPTDQGATLLRHAYAEVRVLEQEFGAEFSAAERETLSTLLDRAAAVLARNTRSVAH